MADETKYPDASVPLVFSDGIVSMTHSPEIVKFYLGRFDAEINANGPSTLATAAQVIMPIPAFISSVLFMDERIERLIMEGHISREQVDEARAKQRANAQNAQPSS